MYGELNGFKDELKKRQIIPERRVKYFCSMGSAIPASRFTRRGWFCRTLDADTREGWPKVKILLRAYGGFCRDYILTWCEGNSVDCILGLLKNKRLTGSTIKLQLMVARVFSSFWYTTQNKSWSKHRRVIAKAEHLEGAPTQDLLLHTSLTGGEKRLYEDVYCARGEMEKRIKKQQLDLIADRTSTHYMSSYQLRVWFCTIS